MVCDRSVVVHLHNTTFSPESPDKKNVKTDIRYELRNAHAGNDKIEQRLIPPLRNIEKEV